MLFSKLVKNGTRLALALILGLGLVGSLPIPVQAQEPIDLVLGGEGATSWNMDKIKPGDSGTKTVELHNAGSRNGSVTIWISDIEEVDYGGDSSVLGNYLLFNLSCDRLGTNVTLPATIHELPQNASDPNYIKINPLYAGENVTLVWQWEFPENGQPQNDAQGDSLSFTINYLLEELPSGGGAPSYQWLKIDILGAVTLVKVSSSGKLLDSYVVTDPDNKLKLEFNQGTKVTCTSGKVPRKIEMKVCEESLSAPDGMEIIGPAYDLIGYVYDSASCSLIFNQPARLTLSYDPSWLPTNTSSILIARHDAEQGWRELELPSGSAAEPGEITALISQTSTFAILAKLALVPPTPSPPAPATFELSDLAINPAQTQAGGPVTISIIVWNTGEVEGSYTLTLKINGQIEQAKEVTLAGGKSIQVSFTVIKDKPGSYTAALDGQTGSFAVLSPPLPSSWGSIQPPFPWVLVGGIIGGVLAAVIVYVLIRRRRGQLCSVDGALLFKVTATVGSGSQEESGIRVYKIVPRPGNQI